MGVRTMFPASREKPTSQYGLGANISHKKTGFGPINGAQIALLREHYNLSTWILLGCVIQSSLYFAFPRSWAAFPPILLFIWGIVDVLLMHFGLKRDIYMDGVIDGKWSVAYPSPGETQAVTGKPGDNGPGAVMILGTRSNSPMGFFAEGFKEVGDRFRDMLVQLEATREESGRKQCGTLPPSEQSRDILTFRSGSWLVMGMSSWQAAGERASRNEYATISYWRSVEDIHRFALSPVHKDAWQWWSDTAKVHKHIGLMHEIFALPERSGWEGIYVNYHPTGLAATSRPVKNKETGEVAWVNPIVDASRGVYRTSHGRMSRGDSAGDGTVDMPRAPEIYNRV